MKTITPYTPIQYVMGKTQFFGLDFEVSEDVLIPRPETEILVETVISSEFGVRSSGFGVHILDLCTGSGNIAISLTKNIPDCTIIASDISEKALKVARQNALSNYVSDRIEFIQSDLFENISGLFDIIVSNPPYIARHEFAQLQKEVLREPRIALDGGEDGCDFYRRIIAEAPRHLTDEGYLVMEIGYGQAASIAGMIRSAPFMKLIEIKKDHNGIDRVMVAQNIWTN